MLPSWMRSSKGSPIPLYLLATLTTSLRFFSIRRCLARLSPEWAFRKRSTSCRRVKRSPLPIFAKYSANRSGASETRGAGGPAPRSISPSGTASFIVPDRTALLFTRPPPSYHTASELDTQVRTLLPVVPRVCVGHVTYGHIYSGSSRCCLGLSCSCRSSPSCCTRPLGGGWRTGFVADCPRHSSTTRSGALGGGASCR